MIKVLLLSADPKENHPLNLDQEFRRIYNKLYTNKQFDVEMRLSATYDDLRQALLSYKPSIIHFSCHGMGEQGLVLVDNDERKDIIDTKTLTELLEICNKDKNIRCVIFNACYGEFQAEGIKKNIKYTIGMSNEIKDNHAIYFAEVFYEALSLNTTIETAFELGRNSIRRVVHNNSSTARAEYDPAPGDIILSQSIPDYEIPKLIVNEELEDIYDLERGFSRQEKIISYQQWNELHSILLTINFDILKNVCRDTLKKEVQDIEPKILSLKTLVDLKELLLEKYSTHKSNGVITILDFASRLRINEELDKGQKEQIQNWLNKIAKEKNIDLPILPEESKALPLPENTILNSHLLITVNQNTEVNSIFSLEAELIDDYQEGNKEYESVTVTSQLEGINEVSLNNIELFIFELISRAIDCLPPNHNLTIELFVPFDYLGQTFELYKIPIPSRRTKRMKALGSQYQFILRSLDRYEDKQLLKEHTNRWMAIKNNLEGNIAVEYIEQNCDYLKSSNREINWDILSTKWQRHNFYAINIIDELPVDTEDTEAYFDSFLLSGVPISLWNRCPEVKCSVDGDNYNVEEKFKELLKIESLKDLSKIFERIYQLRQDAHNAGDIANKYLGYHLGFICDRPDPIPSNLRKRLNQKGLQGTN